MLYGNKGQIFIVVVIVFLAVFGLLFGVTSQYKTQSSSTMERVISLDNFLDDFEQDAQRAAYISGYRSLLAMEEYVASTGHPISNTETSFKEVFWDGTINGTSMDIMNESTFQHYITGVKYAANKLNIQFSTEVMNISLKQITPWKIEITVDMSVTATDKFNLTRFYFNHTVNSTLPIYDLRDPLFSIGTQGKIQRTVRKNNLTEFVSNNNTDSLLEFVESGYYRETNKSPSFLMRFSHNFSPDENGIESIVDIGLLVGQTITVYNKSVVDTIYFDDKEANVTDSCAVQNMPSWFRIDAKRMGDYEINELNWTVCG